MRIRALIVEVGICIQRTCLYPIHFYTLRQYKTCLFRTDLVLNHLFIEFQSRLALYLILIFPEVRIRMFFARTLFYIGCSLTEFRDKQFRGERNITAGFF